jgi:competence transcription factor ComK
LHILSSRNPTPEEDSSLEVTWNPVTKTEFTYLNIDKELTVQKDLMKENMDFWDEVLASYE